MAPIEMNNTTNVFANQSSRIPYPGVPPWNYSRVLMAVAYGTLMITGLIMNLLVFYVIAKKRLLRRSINYFIFNMAVADILLCCFELTVRFARMITFGRWVLYGIPGLISCKLISFLSQMAPLVSTLSLVFMTLDRFFAITYPTRANLRTRKVRRTLLVLSWLVPALYSSKNFYSYILTLNRCGEFWGWKRHTLSNTIVSNFHTITFIIVPLVLITVMYTAIAITLKKGQVFSQNIIPTAQQKIRQKQRKRINILAFSIVLGFALCHSLQYYRAIAHSLSGWTFNKSKPFQDILKVSFVLAFSNATINPVICIVFNREIKRSVKDLFPCFFRRPFGGGSFDFGRSSTALRSLEFDQRTTVTTSSIHRVDEAGNRSEPASEI